MLFAFNSFLKIIISCAGILYLDIAMSFFVSHEKAAVRFLPQHQ